MEGSHYLKGIGGVLLRRSCPHIIPSEVLRSDDD